MSPAGSPGQYTTDSRRVYLTGPLRTFHDVFVRRAIFFVLAVVILLWYPLRHGGTGEQETSRPMTEGCAQTQEPSRPADSAPQMIAGTAGTRQARSAQDVLASEIPSPRVPDATHAASVFPARFRIHISPPLRTFPLLI
jgi:hypothetical protein